MGALVFWGVSVGPVECEAEASFLAFDADGDAGFLEGVGSEVIEEGVESVERSMPDLKNGRYWDLFQL